MHCMFSFSHKVIVNSCDPPFTSDAKSRQMALINFRFKQL